MPQTNKQINKLFTATDFHGVVDDGFTPNGNFIVITGAHPDEEEELRSQLPEDTTIVFFDGHDDLTEDNKSAKIGAWKGRMIKKLGVEKYYEDDEEQIEIIKAMNPDVIVVQVVDGVPSEPMNFVVFTFDGCILPVAEKLQQEGNRVVVGQIENIKNILTDSELKSFKPEDLERKQKRLALYRDVLDIYPAEHLLKEMGKIKNKGDWFILGESNNMFRFAEQALELGFTNGYFPTQEDREFEVSRSTAKEFVKEHYPELTIAEVKEFSDIETAKEFLAETDKFWVLKSQGDAGETVVPETDDIDQAKEVIISKLDEQQKDYETNGFILEEKIEDPIELTPEVCFYNGKPIFYSLDIEAKSIGEGASTQIGCAMNLVVKTDPEDRINKIAFPPIVQELANKHTGIFYWDASILIGKDGKLYFGEFCSNRFGWDSFPTELAMCESLTHFFRSLMVGKNPLTEPFGAAVRLLNIGADGRVVEGANISVKDNKYVYLYDVTKNMKTTGFSWDLGVVTGCGETLMEAVEECYEYEKGVMYDSKYRRPMFDFLSYEYPTSIMNRYNYAINNGLMVDPTLDNKLDALENEPRGLPSIGQSNSY